jgi:hypothetical protein
MLGLNNYTNVYNPYQTQTQVNPTLPGFTGGKMGTTPQQQYTQNAPADQVRTYNALDANKVGDLSNYLVKNGAQASTLQDVLSPKDFENYQAFGALSGGPLKAVGSSTLGPAVNAAMNSDGNSKLLDAIKSQDQDFANNYGGKTIQSSGWTNQGGPGFQPFNQNSGAGANANAISPAYLLNPNQVLTPQQILNNAYANEQGGSGAVADATASINQAVLNPNYAPSLYGFSQNGKTWDNGGDSNATNAAIADAQNTSLGNVNAMLSNILGSTGARNVVNTNSTSTIDNDATLAQLKALGLI